MRAWVSGVVSTVFGERGVGLGVQDGEWDQSGHGVYVREYLRWENQNE